jgi:hypothetical protein
MHPALRPPDYGFRSSEVCKELSPVATIVCDMETLAKLVEQEQKRFTRYQTYEELRKHSWWRAANYPQYARVEPVGFGSDRTSEYPNGRPIEALILSTPKKESRRNYALMQVEHENELPATLALQLTADVLCQYPEVLDELGYNVILLNISHPDGIALQEWVNEAEFTPLSYPLGYYRSAPSEQVAWGYPFAYKDAVSWAMSAEVRASATLIEQRGPTFLHAAHAAAIDDAYFFVSDPSNELLLHDLERAIKRNGLHMQHGTPELPHLKDVPSHPGIYYPALSARNEYDVAGSWGSGTTSTDYVSGMTDNTFSLQSEVPYFTTDALRSTSPSGMTLADAVHLNRVNEINCAHRIASRLPEIERIVEQDYTPSKGRLLRSLQWYNGVLMNRSYTREPVEPTPGMKREITEGEAYGHVQRNKYYGVLWQGAVHNLAKKLGNKAIGIANDVRAEVEEQVNAINEVSPLRVLPLPNLVGAQALSGLVAMQHTPSRPRW